MDYIHIFVDSAVSFVIPRSVLERYIPPESDMITNHEVYIPPAGMYSPIIGISGTITLPRDESRAFRVFDEWIRTGRVHMIYAEDYHRLRVDSLGRSLVHPVFASLRV